MYVYWTVYSVCIYTSYYNDKHIFVLNRRDIQKVVNAFKGLHQDKKYSSSNVNIFVIMKYIFLKSIIIFYGKDFLEDDTKDDIKKRFFFFP